MSAICQQTYQIVIDPATPTGEYSWWKMEQLGNAVRIDSIQGMDMTPLEIGGGVIGIATGLILGCARLIAGETQQVILSRGSSAGLAAGVNGATFAGWIRLTGSGYPPTVGQTYDFLVGWTGEVFMQISVSGFPNTQFFLSGGAGAVAINFDGNDYPAIFTWVFVGLVYDKAAGKVKCYIGTESGGMQAPFEANYVPTGGSGVGAAGFSMSNTSGLSLVSCQADVDEWGFFNRPLTADEIDYLYNLGDGQTSPIVFPP